MRMAVKFYRTKEGREPAYEFIMSLQPKMRAKVYGALELLSEMGSEVRAPFSKSLGEGLFELRCQFGSDAVRVLYFFHKGRIVVLTNGFFKKTQKTPADEIARAKRYRADYLRRMQ